MAPLALGAGAARRAGEDGAQSELEAVVRIAVACLERDVPLIVLGVRGSPGWTHAALRELWCQPR
eukprot:4128423-Lingulodinium_polyedra.AAC.1